MILHEAEGIHYRPHRVQRAMHEAPQGARWACAGYGTGKTTVAVIEAFLNATVTHPGYLGIVAAPTYPLLMQAWFAEWQLWIPREWWILKQDPKKGDSIFVKAPGGETSEILLRSTSNPWSNEGINAAWLIFDEAPRERNVESFNILRSRIRRGYPGRQRGIVLTGPPQAVTHWTAKEFGKGVDTARGLMPLDGVLGWGSRTHAVIRARTSDNPYLPKDYESGLRNRPGATKAWCRQYLDAEFGATEGQIFEMFEERTHVVPAKSLADRAWRTVVAGVDWGYTHPGVMLVAGIDSMDDVYLLAEEVHKGKIIADVDDGWVGIARDLRDKHKVDRWYCDPSQPQSIKALQKGFRRGRSSLAYPGKNDVAEGIRRVAAALERAKESTRSGTRLFISDACVHTLQELSTYARKKDAHGELTESPEKKNDDAADALRYLMMGAFNG